jgi:three-Cys-motif partner protein
VFEEPDDVEEIDLDAELMDNVGPWSIRKNDIVEYYAGVYAEITKKHLIRTYIDGFANRGYGRLKGTDQIVRGSALRVLNMAHPFDRYVFVEQDAKRLRDLRKGVGERENVQIIEGDANVVLPEVLSQVLYSRRERALCFLDPNKMNELRWETIAAAGANDMIDAIIHFPTMDAHRTVLMADSGKIRPAMRAKMNRYYGNETWFEDTYTKDGLLPFEELSPRKRETIAIIEAFRSRLKEGAGFDFVSRGIPMQNKEGGIIYHLLLASHNKASTRLIGAIEKKFIDA